MGHSATAPRGREPPRFDVLGETRGKQLRRISTPAPTSALTVGSPQEASRRTLPLADRTGRQSVPRTQKEGAGKGNLGVDSRELVRRTWKYGETWNVPDRESQCRKRSSQPPESGQRHFRFGKVYFLFGQLCGGQVCVGAEKRPELDSAGPTLHEKEAGGRCVRCAAR